MIRRLAVLALLAACAPGSDSGTGEGDDWAEVRRLGRTVTDADGALVLGWPGSGLAADLGDGPLTLTIDDDGRNIFDVYLDGERSLLTLKPGQHSYPIEGSENADRVELRRASESFATGLTRIVSARGDLSPVPPPGRRILFIGDSITAGYGSVGAGERCGYTPATSSAQDGYAAMTARAFGADYHLVAISGRGVVLNYGDDPRPAMLAHLSLALPDTATVWDASSWQPDVIVVALGTNDLSTNEPGEAFAASYAGLLAAAAADHPGAEIIAATGPLLTGKKAAEAKAGVEAAIAAVRPLGIEAQTVRLALAEDGHVFGCDYHPGTHSIAVMTDAMSAKIAEVMGWTPAG